MVPSKRYPAFVKPYFPPDSRKSLKLPPPFTTFVKGILPVKVLLKDHYDGKVWAVEVAEIGDNLFFLAGWTKFLEDNSLEFGDFLSFQYNGQDEFGFKILRTTAENRAITFAMDFSSDEGLQKDKEEEAVQEEIGNNETNMSEEDEELVEELEEEALITNWREKKARISSARTAKLGESSNASAAMVNFAVEGLNTEAHGKAIVVQSDEDQDFKSKVDGLQNPYFLVKYRKYRANEMYVPRYFVSAFGAELLPEMIIRDPTGRQWSTNFYMRKDRTMWMQGGWGLLARLNNVNEEDFLACELVPSRVRQGSYIQLHIHRMT